VTSRDPGRGYFGVCRAHAAASRAGVGELWYRKGQNKTYLAIAYGFVEVLPDRVTVLARIAEKAERSTLRAPRKPRRRAEERLRGYTRDIDYDRARMALQKSLARLQAASHIPHAGRVGRPHTTPEA
jgi:F-type H+-transporting ATPase subunit epsilon